MFSYHPCKIADIKQYKLPTRYLLSFFRKDCDPLLTTVETCYRIKNLTFLLFQFSHLSFVNITHIADNRDTIIRIVLDNFPSDFHPSWFIIIFAFHADLHLSIRAVISDQILELLHVLFTHVWQNNLRPETIHIPHAVMIPAVDDFNRAVFLSVCKEFIVGTFQGNSVMFLFFHQLFFHCHFNLCQILNNFVQFINLSNIGRSKRNQSIHASTNRIHQSIDWSGQIGNHKEHDNNTNRSTDQNGCQNSLIQLIS